MNVTGEWPGDKTFFARSWSEGQPARQVIPEVQKELERVLAESKR